MSQNVHVNVKHLDVLYLLYVNVFQCLNLRVLNVNYMFCAVQMKLHSNIMQYSNTNTIVGERTHKE